ncbi:MAG: hypothetical protein ABWW65_01310 [Thermoprotei archaeon]
MRYELYIMTALLFVILASLTSVSNNSGYVHGIVSLLICGDLYCDVDALRELFSGIKFYWFKDRELIPTIPRDNYIGLFELRDAIEAYVAIGRVSRNNTRCLFIELIARDPDVSEEELYTLLLRVYSVLVTKQVVQPLTALMYSNIKIYWKPLSSIMELPYYEDELDRLDLYTWSFEALGKPLSYGAERALQSTATSIKSSGARIYSIEAVYNNVTEASNLALASTSSRLIYVLIGFVAATISSIIAYIVIRIHRD